MKNILKIIITVSLIWLSQTASAAWYWSHTESYVVSWWTKDCPTDLDYDGWSPTFTWPGWSRTYDSRNTTNLASQITSNNAATTWTMTCEYWDWANPNATISLTSWWYNTAQSITYSATDGWWSKLSQVILYEQVDTVNSNWTTIAFWSFTAVRTHNSVNSKIFPSTSYTPSFSNNTKHYFKIYAVDIAWNPYTSPVFWFIWYDNILPTWWSLTYSNNWHNTDQTVTFWWMTDAWWSTLLRIELQEKVASIDPPTWVIWAYSAWTVVDQIWPDIASSWSPTKNYNRAVVDNRAYMYRTVTVDHANNTYVITWTNVLKMETSQPTANTILITWTIKNPSWHTTVWTSSSTLYTYVPNVTLTLSSNWMPSGNNLMQFSCNNTSWTAWEAYNTSKSIDITSAFPWCDANQKKKEVYVKYMDIAWNVNTTSGTIIYDYTNPNFDVSNILLKARTGYTYGVENPSDSNAFWTWHYSNLANYTFTYNTEASLWTQTKWPSSVSWITLSDNLTSLVTKSNLWFDNDQDGINKWTMKITVFDAAWNNTTKDIEIWIIPNNISFTNSSMSLSTNPVAPWYPNNWSILADNANMYIYKAIIKDQFNNIVRPLTWIRNIQLDTVFANGLKFLNNQAWWVTYYREYNNNPNEADVPNSSNDAINWNSDSALYNNSTVKTLWTYVTKVKSVIPSKMSGYPYVKDELINMTHFNFQYLPVNDYCWTYRCFWDNSNVSWWPEAAINLWTTTYLQFWPAVEMDMVKTWWWKIFTDNTKMPLTLTFKNNSSNSDFNLSRLNLNFHFTSTNMFADAFMEWDLFSAKQNWVWYNRKDIQFNTDVSLSIPKNTATLPKNITVSWDSYWLWFGNIWFSSFLPHFSPASGNTIALINTSYNTSNIWLVEPYLWYMVNPLAPLVSTSPTVTTDSAGATNKVAVTWNIWTTSKNNISNALDWNTASVIDTTELRKYDFKANIRKNAEMVVKSMNSISSSDWANLNLSTPWDVLYYDFTSCSRASVDWNAWCMLVIDWTAPTNLAWTNKLWISWRKTIVVKWWNIYIKWDMYYSDSTSLFWMVVLKDDTTKTKGWNIYVHPNVTNVVWAAFAEWSILSYNWSQVYRKSNTVEGNLTRQLLWFWSVYSANTIWWSLGLGAWASYTCPYWSDYYVVNKTSVCNQDEATKYDLSQLRRFVLMEWTAVTCNWVSYPWTTISNSVPKSTGTSPETYAIAWKKKCSIGDTPEAWLRYTSKKSPVIFEYDSNIQSIKLWVFSN